MAYPRQILQNYYFSSDLPDYMVGAEGADALQIVLTDDSELPILSVTLYAYDNTVTFTNMSEMVEEYMRNHFYNMMHITIFVNDVNGDYIHDQSCYVIYCDRRMPIRVKEYIGGHFLTLRKSAIVARDYTFRLNCILEPNEMPEVYYYPVIRDSATGKTKAGQFGYGKIGNSYPNCQKLSVSINPKSLADTNKCTVEDVLACTIKVGNRAFTIFYEDEAFMRCLSFKNCFNVWEDFFLRGVTTRKTEVDRQEAVCNGIVQFYDQRDKFTYEFQSTGLPAGVLRALEQLITSREVKLNESSILITDHECAFHDDNAELNTLKFTFRYADDRQHIEQDELPADGIFNDKYNHTFS